MSEPVLNRAGIIKGGRKNGERSTKAFDLSKPETYYAFMRTKREASEKAVAGAIARLSQDEEFLRLTEQNE